VLTGRLGLETARVPHADRAGVLWIGRGRLSAEDGTLHFVTAGDGDLPAGAYDIPYQTISCLMCQPGTTITHDAVRLLARHGTGILMTGVQGVRLYGAMPFGPDDSRLARRQAAWWHDPVLRLAIVRRMYAWRLGEILPEASIEVLRGIEATRVKESYRLTAQRFGLSWKGRRYDRQSPEDDDIPNKAINYAASAVVGAAQVATAAVGAIPQLGFVHEDSGVAFCLDIADLFREAVTLPCAFAAARNVLQDGRIDLEREVRRVLAIELRRRQLVTEMIERIGGILRADTLDSKRPEPLEQLGPGPAPAAPGAYGRPNGDDDRGHA